jgi:hypothetical protein
VGGRTIAQAVSRRLPTVAARVRAEVRSCGNWDGQSGTGPVTVTERSKACTAFARSEARIGGFESNSGHGCLMCVCVYSVCVVLCVGRGLATSWSPSVKWSWNWKTEARAQRGCRASGKKKVALGQVFFEYFGLQILIPPTAPHSSSSIIRGWYNRPVSGRRTKQTQSHPTPRS